MNIIDRVKKIITTPKTEWDVINNEPGTIVSVYTSYVLILAAASALAAFIGYAFVGFNVLGISIRGMDWGVKQAVNVFVSSSIGYFVTSYIMDALAPSFGSEKNLDKTAQLVGYSYTPALLGGLLTILPSLGMIGGLLGLYGVYLLYLGVGPLKKTPEDKKVIYIVVTIIVLIAISFVIGMILGSVLGLSNMLKPSIA